MLAWSYFTIYVVFYIISVTLRTSFYIYRSMVHIPHISTVEIYFTFDTHVGQHFNLPNHWPFLTFIMHGYWSICHPDMVIFYIYLTWSYFTFIWPGHILHLSSMVIFYIYLDMVIFFIYLTWPYFTFILHGHILHLFYMVIFYIYLKWSYFTFILHGHILHLSDMVIFYYLSDMAIFYILFMAILHSVWHGHILHLSHMVVFYIYFTWPYFSIYLTWSYFTFIWHGHMF